MLALEFIAGIPLANAARANIFRKLPGHARPFNRDDSRSTLEGARETDGRGLPHGHACGNPIAAR